MSFARIVDDLEALNLEPGAFEAVMSVLVRHEGRIRINPDVLERRERLRYALHLRGQKLPRPLIRRRLMTRFGISAPTAYRVEVEALQKRPSP